MDLTHDLTRDLTRDLTHLTLLIIGDVISLWRAVEINLQSVGEKVKRIIYLCHCFMSDDVTEVTFLLSNNIQELQIEASRDIY